MDKDHIQSIIFFLGFNEEKTYNFINKKKKLILNM